jgi:hypothetical protein
MWTAAAHLTELVARYRGICAKAADRSNRVLSDAHFMFRDGESEKRGAARQPELVRRQDERSRLTTPSRQAPHLDQVILETERNVPEAQYDGAQAATELAEKEKPRSDRRIGVLRTPTAGVQQ